MVDKSSLFHLWSLRIKLQNESAASGQILDQMRKESHDEQKQFEQKLKVL